MRCRFFCVFGGEASQSAFGCSLLRSRVLFNALQEQPRALRYAPVPNVQKNLQRNFATLYFVCSFFDYLFLQRFILRSFFDYLFRL